MRRLAGVILAFAILNAAFGQVAIRGKVVYPVSGPPIRDGVVLCRDGRIERIGANLPIPAGYRVFEAAVVTPGFIDVRTTLGLTGIFNSPGHDQDQLDRSAAVQPELRAIDAYNPQEPLIAYVRSFGVTTVNAGHAPGELISGQTGIFKLKGNSIDEAVVQTVFGVCVTLGPESLRSASTPGTRAKQISMLRAELLAAKAASEKKDGEQKPESLKQEMFRRVLAREVPLIVTAHRKQDILAALRLQAEFGFRMVLDGAAEAYSVLEELKQAAVPVFLHAPMARANGSTENASLETAAKLHQAQIPFAIQTGYESYVPKVRVLTLEVAMAAANGLGFEAALRSATLGAAQLLGIAGRVGSLEVGKDADLALFDGDPFEYTTRCTGVFIDGQPLSVQPR